MSMRVSALKISTRPRSKSADSRLTDSEELGGLSSASGSATKPPLEPDHEVGPHQELLREPRAWTLVGEAH